MVRRLRDAGLPNWGKRSWVQPPSAGFYPFVRIRQCSLLYLSFLVADSHIYTLRPCPQHSQTSIASDDDSQSFRSLISCDSGEEERHIQSSPILDLTARIKTTGRNPVAHGGFSDIYLGRMTSESRSEDGSVLVKTSQVRGLVFAGACICNTIYSSFGQCQVAVKLLRVLTKQELDGDKLRRVGSSAHFPL